MIKKLLFSFLTLSLANTPSSQASNGLPQVDKEMKVRELCIIRFPSLLDLGEDWLADSRLIKEENLHVLQNYYNDNAIVSADLKGELQVFNRKGKFTKKLSDAACCKSEGVKTLVESHAKESDVNIVGDWEKNNVLYLDGKECKRLKLQHPDEISRVKKLFDSDIPSSNEDGDDNKGGDEVPKKSKISNLTEEVNVAFRK